MKEESQNKPVVWVIPEESLEESAGKIEEEAAKKYANRIGYSDVYPFEIIRIVSEKVIEIRAMDSECDPDWKPEMVAGGFSAHCTNSGSQKWIITSDAAAQVIRIRKHKNGKWFDANGEQYRISEWPRRFYDYNF